MFITNITIINSIIVKISRFLLSGYSPDTKTSKVSSLLLPPPHPANPPKLPKNQSPIVPSIIETSKTPKQKTGNSGKEELPLFQRRTKLSSPRITESSSPARARRSEKTEESNAENTRNQGRNYSEPGQGREERKIEGKGGEIEAEKRIPVGGGD